MDAPDLEAELNALEMRAVSATLRRAVRTAEDADARALMRAVHQWHAALMHSGAYAAASQRANEVIVKELEAGHGPLMARTAAIGRARSATCSFLRLAGGHPAVYQQLQRALGVWHASLHAFDARELRKEIGMAAERAKNLKRGWKDEREARMELERKLATAEGEASEACRALKAAEAEVAASSAASQPAAARGGRPSCLPRPSSAPGLPTHSSLPPAPHHPRIKELEQRVVDAKEEAARAIEAAKVDRHKLSALQKEHAPLLAEAKALKGRDFGEQRLQAHVSELRKRLSSVPLERAALKMRILALGLEGPRARLHEMRAVCVASALARAKLKETVSSLRGSLHGERWRGARMLWRSCERARLARGVSTWWATVVMLRAQGRHHQKEAELEARGEREAMTSEAERDSALEKLRRAADAKLRKERQLATTRMLERDALVRQVKQLQAQLRHSSAMRHPSPGQDTYVPSGASKGGVDMERSSGREASPGAIPSATANGPSGRRGGRAGSAGEGAGMGALPARRAPVPKRSEAGAPSLLEEESKELRQALSASRHEKDVLQCEVQSMRLELDTLRELMQS